MSRADNRSFSEKYLIPSKHDTKAMYTRKILTLCGIGVVIIGIVVLIILFATKDKQVNNDIDPTTDTSDVSTPTEPTPEPEPEPDPLLTLAWEETPIEKAKTYVVASAAVSREKPAPFAPEKSTLKKGDDIKVVATTDNGYYKLEDGSFVATGLLEDKSAATNAGMKPSGKGDEPEAPAVPTQSALEKAQAAGIRDEYADVYAKNRQLKAVLTVPGTGRTYYVAQSGDNSAYLNKNFFGGRSVWGNPYLDFRVKLNANERTPNILVYAHSNDSTGDQFSGFKNYKDVNFYKTNPTIKFRSAYNDEGSDYYKVVAFFKENTKPGTNFFQYHMGLNFSSQAELDTYITNARNLSYWSNDVDYQFGDEFVTFSTCFDTNSENWNRLVTVARRVRPDESTMVDTSNCVQIRDIDLNAKGK